MLRGLIKMDTETRNKIIDCCSEANEAIGEIGKINHEITKHAGNSSLNKFERVGLEKLSKEVNDKYKIATNAIEGVFHAIDISSI